MVENALEQLLHTLSGFFVALTVYIVSKMILEWIRLEEEKD